MTRDEITLSSKHNVIVTMVADRRIIKKISKIDSPVIRNKLKTGRGIRLDL